jgi:hypothetical protein
MKANILILSFSIVPSLLFAAAGDYKKEIVQINYEEGLEPHVHVPMEVDDKGTGLASKAIMGRAEFRLIATRITEGDDKGFKHDLAKTSVASFDTDAFIKAVGPPEDEYNTADRPIHRTQIGQGYTLSITASGMIPPGEGVSDAESSIYLERSIYPYSADQVNSNAGVAPTLVINSDYAHEGTDTLDKSVAITVSTQITDLTRVRGEETHITYIKPDDTVDLKTELSATTIQVWPIGNGSFNFPVEDVYRTLPEFSVSIVDLYPSAEIVFEITGGQLDSSARVSIVTNRLEIPFSNDFDIKTKIQNVIEVAGSGVYNINMLKISPYDTVTLGNRYINYVPTIKVNASITTGK